MTELVHHQTSSDLSEQMDYARAISSASMLPQQYRGKPADILIATGLGRAMGLSPAESLYRIHVIQGRPTASAELIAANVRKAGHVLRVKGDEQQARAVIIRHDDPGFEFESVWDLERAKRLGLTDKDGWRKQPGTMMRWRAITEVARLACPEALYGVAYVREEIEDEQRSTPARVSVLDFTKTDAGTVESPEAAGPALSETSDEEAVPVPASTDTGEAITDAQRRALFGAFTRAGFDSDARSAEGREARLSYLSTLLQRDVDSTNDLTREEASIALDALAGIDEFVIEVQA